MGRKSEYAREDRWGNTYVKKRGVVVITAKAEPGFNFIVHEKLGEIGVAGKYSKELRIVEWGRYDPKFDIRPWDTSDEEGRRMNKGITMNLEELIQLKIILDRMDLDGYKMPDKKIQPEIV